MHAPNRFVGIVLMVIGVGIVSTGPANAAGAPRPTTSASRPEASASRTKAPKAKTTASDQRIYHTVRRGQTLYSIARQYGVPLKTLSAANAIANPANIKAGLRLVIPGARKRTAPPSRSIAPSAAAQEMPVAPGLDTERVFLTAPLAWPVDGQVVSAFARPRRGYRHKGIDIKSEEGAPVRAVADGTVIRVEERYGSYGRLIVIEHENGMLSYYGHNKKNLVQAGQTVAAEETIGLVGHSGNATCDHLHFELHVRGQAVDPLPALASLPKTPSRAIPRESFVTSSTIPSGEPVAATAPAARR